MTRFPKLWVTKAWLASAFYSAIYLLISFCTVHCTYLSHWGFLTNAIYKVQTLHVKWCVNVMACWCHCLKQLPFSLGWLNSPRCWLAPLCKVGRPTRRLGDKERALPCRDVPLTSHRELPLDFWCWQHKMRRPAFTIMVRLQLNQSLLHGSSHWTLWSRRQ